VYATVIRISKKYSNFLEVLGTAHKLPVLNKLFINSYRERKRTTESGRRRLHGGKL
jgi:hypothetical protein